MLDELARIEYAINERPDRTFAFDEFGPLGIRPTAGSYWAERGRPDRLPATFRRTHGITYFHGCYSVGDDQMWGVNHRRKGVILDNLSAHTNWRMKRWAAKNKVELCKRSTLSSLALNVELTAAPRPERDRKIHHFP
ncbi:hypothetical protein [Streptomyces sp. NBC_01205]|uniref:hypothetical protein n=1 Tax=unclassified Streptomyces TaxID=2593676 RepID=UPI003FA37A24